MGCIGKALLPRSSDRLDGGLKAERRSGGKTYEDKRPRHGEAVVQQPPDEVGDDAEHHAGGDELRQAQQRLQQPRVRRLLPLLFLCLFPCGWPLCVCFAVALVRERCARARAVD